MRVPKEERGHTSFDYRAGPPRDSHEMETPDTYCQKAEAADRAAEAARDDQAKRMFKLVAERWRKLADIARRISNEERKSH